MYLGIDASFQSKSIGRRTADHFRAENLVGDVCMRIGAALARPARPGFPVSETCSRDGM